jgi:hypothetical protein
MKIYLNGVEYKTYRKILKNLGVRFGCLNYGYLWSRTPRFNLEQECEFLDELIVDPGFLRPDYVYDYMDFLHEHADRISFAIELYTEERTMLKEDCAVEIVPWYNTKIEAPMVAVSTAILTRPFIKNSLLRLKEQGSLIHGINCELPFFDSINSSTWMRSQAGWISHFDKKNKMRVNMNSFTASAFARELKLEGYDIDLDKVKRGDWKELALVNGIAWKKYQNYLEVR